MRQVFEARVQNGIHDLQLPADEERMAESLPEGDLPVLDFLYAPDCEGEMDPEHCRALASLMDRTREEWQDEGRSYAYAAYDPFTLADFYNLVQDGWDTGEGISWV